MSLAGPCPGRRPAVAYTKGDLWRDGSFGLKTRRGHRVLPGRRPRWKFDAADNGESRNDHPEVSTRLGRRSRAQVLSIRSQTEDEQFAEIEAAREAEGTTLMAVPTELAAGVSADRSQAECLSYTSSRPGQSVERERRIALVSRDG